MLWLNLPSHSLRPTKIIEVSTFYEHHDKEIKCLVGLHDTVIMFPAIMATEETRNKIFKYVKLKYK